MVYGFKLRRHHNTDGRVAIKSGRVEKQVREIAMRLNIPYAKYIQST